MIRSQGPRQLLTLLFSLLLVASASACGGSDSAGSGSGSDSETSSEESEGSESGGSEAEVSEGSDSDGSDAASDSTLTIAIPTDMAADTYNPARFAALQFPFHGLVYDTLFVTNSAGEVVPSLVSDFSTSEDNKTLSLTLREDSTFADGTALTAEVVKANLDRRLTEELSAYGQFAEGQEAEITEITVTGDYELTISWGFEDGLADGHNLLADTAGAIVGPNGAADSATLEASPEGSGAYTVVEDKTTRGSSYTLAKNADHWNAAAYAYDTIVFSVIPDHQARANAVASGEADVAIEIKSEQLGMLESQAAVSKAGGNVASWPVLDKTGTTNAAFAHVETRLALIYAIDRETIVAALRPSARPTAQLFPQAALGHDPSIDERYAFDPDKARELLASVGLEDGFEFDKMTFGDPTDVELAIQQMWKEELNVTLNFTPAANTGELFAAVRTQPLIYNEWGLGNQPAGFVAGAVVGGFMNYQEAESEAISANLGPALGGDPDALVALNNALTDDGWWIGIFEDFSYAGYNPDTVQTVPFAGIAGYIVVSEIVPA